MPIPTSKPFHDALDSIVLCDIGQQGEDVLTLLPTEFASDEEGWRYEQSEFRVTYPADAVISFEALRRRIAEELQRGGHISDDMTVRTVIALYCVLKKPSDDSIETLNEILTGIADAHLTQIWIGSTPPPPNFSFSMGRFRIGTLAIGRLSDRCRRANSDFFDRYSSRLRGKFAIEREYFVSKVIDWERWVEGPKYIRNEGRLQDAVYRYFSAVARSHINQFWEALLADQDMYLAFANAYLPPDILKLWPMSQVVTVFLNIGEKRWGFVSPNYGVELDFAGIEKKVPTARRALAEEYGFQGWEDTELHQTLHTYAQFVSKAKQHEFDGRSAESFLHHIIALDLLFGERESTTSTVASRTAVLTHQSAGRTFEEQVTHLSRLYDARSRYVHQGIQPKADLLDSAQEVTYEVLCCLLRLQQQRSDASDESPIDHWQRELDFIAAAIRAGRPQDHMVFVKAGVAPADCWT